MCRWNDTVAITVNVRSHACRVEHLVLEVPTGRVMLQTCDDDRVPR